MRTYLWDPFAALDRFDREFDSIIRGAFGWDGRAAQLPAARRAVAAKASPFGTVVPSADVVQAGDDVVIKLELPGVDVEKDITVEIDRGRLVVRGERGESTETNDGDRIRRERWHGSFRREFAIPESVAADKVVATYDRGVLSVRLPGAAAAPASHRVPVRAAGTPAELTATAPAEAAEVSTTAQAAEHTQA